MTQAPKDSVDAIRAEWKDEPDSELKRASLKLCDDYEAALKSIIVSHKEAEELLTTGQVTLKKVLRYGDVV